MRAFILGLVALILSGIGGIYAFATGDSASTETRAAPVSRVTEPALAEITGPGEAVEAVLAAVRIQEAHDQTVVAALVAQQRAASRRTVTRASRYPSGCPGGEAGCIATATPCAVPDYVCHRESSAINKWNYGGSGASGKYQAMPSTWGGYGGYANAADAPEAVQDAWAAELWNGGAGCSHWSACG